MYLLLGKDKLPRKENKIYLLSRPFGSSLVLFQGTNYYKMMLKVKVKHK